tara:strand:+ start:6050 stop:6283 length:234 start_codon:yes stop_codon:yes gene_type:complete
MVLEITPEGKKIYRARKQRTLGSTIAKEKLDKKYYTPTYGTAECSYKGKKRGRKTLEEKIKEGFYKKKQGDYTLFFD